MKNVIFKTIGFWLNSLTIINKCYAGKKGMFIFCKPIKLQIGEKQIQQLKEAAFATVNVNGETVQIYKWGNGAKKVLLVHGWSSYSLRWKFFIDRLQQQDVTVYAFDAVGHGLSTGKQLNVFINATTIAAVVEKTGTIDTLFAHSFGAFSAIYALDLKPGLPIKECIMMAAAENADSFFDFYKQTLGLTDATTNAIIDEFIALLGNYPGYYKASLFAKKLQQPCLIIHDKFDNETPYQGAVDIHANWKNAQLITTENIGHQMKYAPLSEFIIKKICSNEPINNGETFTAIA
jgi:pimeloyl-ACP methyl ester carboxylesterase